MYLGNKFKDIFLKIGILLLWIRICFLYCFLVVRNMLILFVYLKGWRYGEKKEEWRMGINYL